MEQLLWTAGLALWLGILTSITPCPLATNVTAMSFIARKVGSSRHVLLSGFLYTVGRVVTYVALAALLVAGLGSAPGLSIFLQTYLNKLIGPLLVLVGMFLVELLQWNFRASLAGEGVQERAKEGGLAWAFLLGILFACTFCPPAAAIFFGTLVPLALRQSSPILIPMMYGVGTGLPVVVFAVAIARGAEAVGKLFGRIQAFEWWARRITGIIFILAGIYLSLTYIYGVM